MPTSPLVDGSRTADDGTSGSCYGFEVRSSLPHRYLRPGSGRDLLRIEEWEAPEEPSTEPIFERLPRLDKPLHARIFADGERFRVWTDPDGWFGIDPAAGLVGVPRRIDPVRREERVWGYPAMLLFLARGDLPIHASAVDVGGRALVFAAPGQHGKTTIASAFHAAGHRLLSDDITCCRPGEDVAVLPGPAVTRLRRDAYRALDVPDVGIAMEEPERVHLSIDPARRGDGRPVPLHGIVLLRAAEKMRLVRLGPEAAIPDLWTLIFKLPRDAEWARCFDATAAVAGAVPVWNLYRPLAFDTLPDLLETIVDTCLAGRP